MRDALRAEKILQERLFARQNIHVLWDHAVDEIPGAGQPPVVKGTRKRDEFELLSEPSPIAFKSNSNSSGNFTRSARAIFSSASIDGY